MLHNPSHEAHYKNMFCYRKQEKYTVHRKRNRLIAEVHKINKGINAVKSNKNISDAERIQQLADLQKQKDEVINYIILYIVSKCSIRVHFFINFICKRETDVGNKMHSTSNSCDNLLFL